LWTVKWQDTWDSDNYRTIVQRSIKQADRGDKIHVCVKQDIKVVGLSYCEDTVTDIW